MENITASIDNNASGILSVTYQLDMKKASSSYGSSVREALLSNSVQLYNVNIHQSKGID